jgi:hypothetical protein
MSNLRWASEDPHVVAIREHAAAADPIARFRDRSVEPMGRGYLEALHAARERAFVARLDDQVHVVLLQADLADAEVSATKRRWQGLPERVVCVAFAQPAEVSLDAERDVRRGPRRQ